MITPLIIIGQVSIMADFTIYLVSITSHTISEEENYSMSAIR